MSVEVAQSVLLVRISQYVLKCFFFSKPLLCSALLLQKNYFNDALSVNCSFRKRHEKAEKEYVNSKLDLKLKEERKEELTQHLYTIIQENELRKANKLEELMRKLNLPKHKPKEESREDHKPNQNDTLDDKISST